MLKCHGMHIKLLHMKPRVSQAMPLNTTAHTIQPIQNVTPAGTQTTMNLLHLVGTHMASLYLPAHVPQILEEEIYRKERGEQGRVVQDTLEIRHTLSHAEWHLVSQGT